jgi:general secretion pathway protein F
MSTLPRTSSFLFVASKMGGKRTLGVRQASSQRALAEALRRERLMLVRSFPLPKWAGSAMGRDGSASALKLKDTVALNEQLAQLLSRGVPLVEALDVVAMSVQGAAQPVVNHMREQVAAGASFADACQKSGSFDRVTVAVYRAAERTGDLGGATRSLGVTARRQMSVQGKATTLLIYPSIVISISVTMVIVMLTFIVPRIGQSLSSMRVKLPWFSKFVFAVGTWMRENLLLFAGGLGVLLIVLIVMRKPVFKAMMRGARRLPAMRNVILAQESTRFFSTMGAMTRSGVPLADALGVANEAVGLPMLRTQLEALRTKLIEGGVLRNLIESVSALPVATRRLLIAAERAGDLESAFDTLAADMAEETDRRTSRLLAILEPLLIILMFLIIGTILMAIFIPVIMAAGSSAG